MWWIGPQFIGPSNKKRPLMHKKIPNFVCFSFLDYKMFYSFFPSFKLTLCNLFVIVDEQTEEELQRQKAIDDWLPITSSRNAKWWYSAFHNVTAMVGAGVLSLPYAMSELGWYALQTQLSLIPSLFKDHLSHFL